MATDQRAYVFGCTNGRWGFIAMDGSLVQRAISHAPLETWKTEGGTYTLCRVRYSQVKAAELIRTAGEQMMQGPELFVLVGANKKVVAGVWKPPIKDTLEITFGADKTKLIPAEADLFAELKDWLTQRSGLITVEIDAAAASLKQWMLDL